MFIKLSLFVLILHHVKSNEEETVLRCNFEADEITGELWCTVQNNHETGSYVVDLNADSQNVTKARFLNSTFNNIPRIQNMQNILFLNVEEIELQQLNQDDFIGAESLMDFNGANNKLKILNEEIFMHAANLETINLGYNSISDIHVDAFKGLDKLRILFLPNNQIKSIQAGTFLGKLITLEELNLRTNWLRIIHGDTFDNNKNLTTIILKNNYITQVSPKAFLELPNLKTLNMERNTCIIPKGKVFINGSAAEEIIQASDCSEKFKVDESAWIKILGILFAVLLGACIILPVIVMCFFGFQGAYNISS